MTASRTLERDPQAGSSGLSTRGFLRWLNGLVDRARGQIDRGVGFLARMRTPLGNVRPYVRGETRVARLLAVPAIIGFASAVAIAGGASLPSSPFTWKSCSGIVSGSVTVCHPWFFGIPAPPVVAGAPLPANKDLFIGLVAVYGGMVLMLQAWIALIRIARRHRGLPSDPSWLCSPPGRPPFSSSRRCQPGLLQLRGPGRDDEPRDQPVLVRAGVLGVNAFSGLVDKLWADVTSPYGPLFLWMAAVNATVVRHDELLAVVGFRLLALVGVVMIGIFVPRLARSYGRDPSVAFVLAVLNPLVLLHLIAGAHNDALMLGFLLAGLWFAREGRPVVGVLLCTIGAMIKIPAFVGVVYIGWSWLATTRRGGPASGRPSRRLGLPSS